jgi:hypothetical protein
MESLLDIVSAGDRSSAARPSASVSVTEPKVGGFQISSCVGDLSSCLVGENPGQSPHLFSQEDKTDIRARPVGVRHRDPEHRERLEQTRLRQWSTIDWVESQVARQPCHHRFRAGIVAAEEHAGALRSESRIGHVGGTNRVERLHNPGAGSPGCDVFAGRQVPEGEAGEIGLERIRCIDHHLAAQVAGVFEGGLRVAPRCGEYVTSAPTTAAFTLIARARFTVAVTRVCTFASFGLRTPKATSWPFEAHIFPSVPPTLPAPMIAILMASSLRSLRLSRFIIRGVSTCCLASPAARRRSWGCRHRDKAAR